MLTKIKSINQLNLKIMDTKTILADSHSADFQEGTWTFEPQEEFTLIGGVFAIIPEPQYQKLLTAVRGIRNSMAAHPDYEPDSEFYDMVSRVDEILTDLEE